MDEGCAVWKARVVRSQVAYAVGDTDRTLKNIKEWYSPHSWVHWPR